MSQRFLSEKQSEMGHAAFYAQYLQKPLVEEDCPIDFGKIKYISRDEFSQIDLVPTLFQSWDTALSDKPTADYSAVTTWARFEDGRLGCCQTNEGAVRRMRTRIGLLAQL